MTETREFTDQDFEPAALDALDGTAHVFLTGRAGTGKSTLINHWIRTRGRGGRTLTCAPTGIAALNAGGVTIHQLIHAGPDVTPERAAAEGRRRAGEPLYRILDTLVIDEVSMLRADLADSLDRFLKGARRSRQPFGGIRLIMVGDLAQLPPIVTKDDRERFDGGEWDGPWFFQSHAIQTILDDNRLQGVELTRAHRQTDRAFLAALDDMRDGHPAPGTLAMLNRRAGAPWNPLDTTVICARNSTADQINRMMLQRLPGPHATRYASTAGDWPQRLEPAPYRLDTRPGMRIMLTSNDADGRWANGTMGTLTDMDPQGWWATVRPDADDTEEYTVKPHSWTRTRPTTWEDPETGEERIILEETGRYTQLPLRPGWAFSIHKSQGQSVGRLRVDLGARLFSPGQAYVALSRARDYNHLSLSRPLTAADVFADPDAIAFLEKIRHATPVTQDTLF